MCRPPPSHAVTAAPTNETLPQRAAHPPCVTSDPERPAGPSGSHIAPSCMAAVAAGYGPSTEGVDPEYGWYRDGDHDGIDCEHR